MRSSLRRTGRAFIAAARAMLSHEVPRDAGAICYFSLFALFPAILVLFAIVDAFLGLVSLHETVVKRIGMLFPGSSAFLAKNLSELSNPSPALFLSCFLVMMWGSTWVFTFVENALNRSWGVSRRRTFWESRVRSITLLVLGGVLLLSSALMTAVGNALFSQAAASLPEIAQGPISVLWSWILLGAGYLMAITVFFFIYKLMPDRRVRWFEALSGAVVAATLWEIGSFVFVKLVPIFDSQKVYGTTGAIIAVLTWVYVSSLIMLYGANFSAKLHRSEVKQPPKRIPKIGPGRAGKKPGWEGNVRSFPTTRRQ